jgi:hypothetical protein
MSLTFLVPLALIGAAMVVVPVVLHLIDRRRVPRIDFPALRFLMAAQKRLRKRRRVRDPWLMLLRILALLALVLAFAGPTVKYLSSSPAGAELNGNVVFLVDNSMSMGYRDGNQTLFDRARQRVEDVLERMPEGGRAGLIVFNRNPDDLLGGVTPDLGKVRTALADVKLSYDETDLRAAILAGLRALLATPEGGGDLYLLSDQTQASLVGDGVLTLPVQLEGKVRLVISELHDGPRPDRALMGVTAGREGGEGGKVKITAQVRAQGEGSAGEAPLDLTLGGQVVSRGFVKVAANGSVDKVFTLPSQADPEGEGVLTLGADNLPADDNYYFRLSNRRDLKALVIDGDGGENLATAESFFVERALNPRRASGSRITPVVVGEGAVGKLDPREYAVVFLLNVADPGPLADRLVQYVKGGGGLFIAMGDRARIELYNRRLGELLPASVGDVKAAAPDLTGEKPPALVYPEVNHPIFQVFREAGASVFSTISFYKVVPTAPTLKPGGEVLLKYTNGLPALLGRSVGTGRVLLFTSTLDRDWNDFPLKSIFLPFIQESTHYLARNPTGEDRTTLYTVGQPVILEIPAETGALSVLDPSGRERSLEEPGQVRSSGQNDRPRRVMFREAKVPGHYRVLERRDRTTPPIPRPDLSFAVNVPAREKDLTPLQIAALQARVSGLPVVVEGKAETAGEVKVERKRALNHSLLWLFLVFLVLEGAFAALRRRAQEAEATRDLRSGPGGEGGGEAVVTAGRRAAGGA